MPVCSPIENEPLITLFTAPKSCLNPQDHIRIIQQNAISSWARLPRTNVIVLGSEPGIAEIAEQLSVQHIADLEYNENGTPLVSSAFQLAQENSNTPWLAYCNCDVILMDEFVHAIESVWQNLERSPCVAFGRRTDLEVTDAIDFCVPEQRATLKQAALTGGTISSQVCKEYFAFERSVYPEVPEFAIGRGNWDNWMIWSAKKSQIPVVNVSEHVTAIHQSHRYQHTAGNRRAVYVSGHEAKRNQQLAGGCHWFSGSIGTHRLNRENDVVREKPWFLNRHFWADVPRFTRLVSSLVMSR